MRIKLRLFLFVFASIQALFAQSAPPAQAPSVGTYESFLRNLAVISAKSDSLNTAGVTNQELKQGVCGSLAINAADCNLLFQIAVATSAQLQALDRQATAIISAVRAQYPHGAMPAGVTLPPPPPALGQLQAQREALVGSAVASLQQQLTAAGGLAITKRLSKSQTAQ